MNDSPNPPRVRILPASSGSPGPVEPVKGLQRAAGALRVVLPHLLRLLPLLDGNIGSAVSNLLSPPPPLPAPAPPVDLTPIEHGLANLQAEHRNLRGQVLEQNASLERVGDRLETVGQAAANNALAQQALLRELKAVGGKVQELEVAGRKAKVFAIVALGLLALFILLNAILLLHLRRILP